MCPFVLLVIHILLICTDRDALGYSMSDRVLNRRRLVFWELYAADVRRVCL